jgi:Baseplate J-like protein
MATINVQDDRQVIDYMARDYASFRNALIGLIPRKLPEWTDRSEADFGIVMIELFAYMADILSYYQDRIANEAFLTTAQERRSVIEHLNLIGYELQGAAPATAHLSVIVGNTTNDILEIRAGDQFSTGPTKDRRSVIFEYVDAKPLVIDLSKLGLDTAMKDDGVTVRTGFKEAVGVIPVREGKSVANEPIGVSDGTPNQTYLLAQSNVLRDSIKIVTDTNPPGPPWNLQKKLIFSGPAYSPEQLATLLQQGRIASTLAFSRSPDRDFAIATDENEVTTIVFGDGQYGEIPPVGAQILASYRTGGGAIGNVGSGQITIVSKSPQLQVLGAQITNRIAASGGAERETIDQSVKFAPTLFSSMQRAVTAQDYAAQALLFPGISKARAAVANWNYVNLYVAPAGDGELPSDILKSDLLTYFEDRRMLTTFINIQDPNYVRIEVRAAISSFAFFKAGDVFAAAQAAIQQLLAFENAEFAQTLYLSKIYEVLEAVPGVDTVFVSAFNRADALGDLTSDGRILMGENEIPVLRDGDLNITVTGGV